MSAVAAPVPASASVRNAFWPSISAPAASAWRWATRCCASAQPLTTVAAQGEARFAAIDALVREWQPAALVVGVPFHPDGAEHENTQRARRFGRQLHGRFRLPVHEVDERYSTTEALADGAADVDAASAAVILDQFLRQLP